MNTTWTKEKPTQPGWYWYRHAELPAKPFIVWVNHLNEATESGSTTRYDLKRLADGEWAGPLEVPHE